MGTLLLDKLFFSVTDLSEFRDISANIDTAKFEIYIRECQAIEIKGFLGAVTYQLMQNDFTAPDTFAAQRFTDLWFGKAYTNSDSEVIQMNGLMSAAIYWAYSRFLIQQQTNVGRFGVQSLQDESSEDQGPGTVRGKADQARTVALSYQKLVETFLNDQDDIYPEYHNATKKTPVKVSKSFFKLKTASGIGIDQSTRRGIDIF